MVRSVALPENRLQISLTGLQGVPNAVTVAFPVTGGRPRTGRPQAAGWAKSRAVGIHSPFSMAPKSLTESKRLHEFTSRNAICTPKCAMRNPKSPPRSPQSSTCLLASPPAAQAIKRSAFTPAGAVNMCSSQQLHQPGGSLCRLLMQKSWGLKHNYTIFIYRIYPSSNIGDFWNPLLQKTVASAVSNVRRHFRRCRSCPFSPII